MYKSWVSYTLDYLLEPFKDLPNLLDIVVSEYKGSECLVAQIIRKDTMNIPVTIKLKAASNALWLELEMPNNQFHVRLFAYEYHKICSYRAYIETFCKDIDKEVSFNNSLYNIRNVIND